MPRSPRLLLLCAGAAGVAIAGTVFAASAWMHSPTRAHATPDAADRAPAPVGKIAFVTARGTVVQIVLADASGTDARPFARAPNVQEYQPTWSRDGKRIAWVGLVHGDPATAEILVDSGNHLRQLTRNNFEDDFPTWAPDGRHIAFYSFRPQGAGIYVMDADGTHQRLLEATTAPISWAPSWAPDGKSIAFVRGLTADAEIYTISPSGRGLRRLTDNRFYDSDPSWSPDGGTIVFASERGGHSSLYLMNGDGSHERRLTDGPGDDLHPTWSPDARWIAFVRRSPGGTSRVYLVESGGTNERPLSADPAANTFDPSWSPRR